MRITLRHILIFKHFLILCLGAFALSPCIVKEAMFGSAEIEYTRPFNKTKTTNTINICAYFQRESLQISADQKTKIKHQTEHFYFSEYPFFEINFDKVKSTFSEGFSGNSPPKYILFKRLKIAVA